ncbi:unnamed protein product [Symbiodinium sp. CCMP2456]|nr:unnamed protein product [Symbiodinium sp. CCMP2456]
MMETFSPQKEENEVVGRRIIEDIRCRILQWNDWVTGIEGRFGSGKSVAVEEALRGRQGVYVHNVWDKDWENQLCCDLGLDHEFMLQDVLRLVKKRNQGSTPILVLKIRTTEDVNLNFIGKEFSCDSKLAHAGVSIICAFSDAMEIAFGTEMIRMDTFRVGDLTRDEAKELLNLHGLQDKTDEFLEACPLAALFGLFCRETHPALSGPLQREGASELCTHAAGRDVARWLREKHSHPVIWEPKNRGYQFASELHAKVAAEILNSSSQSTP